MQPACARDDFRPQPGPLCAYCSFQEFCPAFGGDPALAERAARARHACIAPALPLAVDRRVAATLVSMATGLAASRVPKAPCGPGVRPRRRPLARARSATRCSTASSTGSRARPTTACSGSASGGVRAPRRGDLTFAAAFGARWASSPALTNGADQVGCSGGSGPCTRPPEGPLPYGLHRPITSSFPSGHATAAFTAARSSLRPVHGDAGLVRARGRGRVQPGVRAAAPRVRRRRRRRVGLVLGRVAAPVLASERA